LCSIQFVVLTAQACILLTVGESSTKAQGRWFQHHASKETETTADEYDILNIRVSVTSWSPDPELRHWLHGAIECSGGTVIHRPHHRTPAKHNSDVTQNSFGYVTVMFSILFHLPLFTKSRELIYKGGVMVL